MKHSILMLENKIANLKNEIKFYNQSLNNDTVIKCSSLITSSNAKNTLLEQLCDEINTRTSLLNELKKELEFIKKYQKNFFN